MDEYVIMNKTDLVSMADTIRDTLGSTDSIAVTDLGAKLIESIEAGGGGGGKNIDWRGFPVLTGTFTPSQDISSDYIINFQDGERLRYKTIDGSRAKWKTDVFAFPRYAIRRLKKSGIYTKYR